MELFRRGELDVAIMALLSPDQGIIVTPHAIAKARKDEMGNIVVELKNHPEHLKVRLMAGVLKACKSHQNGGLLHCCFNSAQDSLPLTSDLIPLRSGKIIVLINIMPLLP